MTNARKRDLVVAAVAAAVVVIFASCLIRGSRDYRNRSEAELVAELGAPAYDSRQEGAEASHEDYTLGWYLGWGRLLSVRMKRGRSVGYYTSSK